MMAWSRSRNRMVEDEEEESFRAEAVMARMLHARRAIAVAATVAGLGGLLAAHPPIATAQPGELGLRTNQFTGAVTEWRNGSILVLPLVHEVQVFSVTDRTCRPRRMTRVTAPAPRPPVALAAGLLTPPRPGAPQVPRPSWHG